MYSGYPAGKLCKHTHITPFHKIKLLDVVYTHKYTMQKEKIKEKFLQYSEC